MVAINGTALQKFMTKSGIANVTPDAMHTFMKNMNKDAIDSYLSENKIYHGTVGPSEAILTPFDCIFVEKVGQDCDLIGSRINYWLKDEADTMETLSRWFVSVKKPNPWLQQAVETLAAEDMD